MPVEILTRTTGLNNSMDYVVGVDIGGTFTDCVVVDEEGAVTIGKSLSTPKDFSQGALDAVADAAKNLGLKSVNELLGSTRLFFHACTIGDNTLITRAGAKTALIMTKGFGDSLHMMRGKIAEGLTENEIAHRSALDKPDPFVPRTLIEEIPERVDYKGAVLIRLDVKAAEQAIERLVAKGAEAVAVCFLWSIMNDAHEKQLAEILRKKYPNLFFSLSSEVAPYLGEYERAATTVFNAYIGPKISAYLRNLQSILQAKGLGRNPLIMQAYGGVLGIEATCKNAVGVIESGPAAGVVGTRFLGQHIGEKNILATDMGGTTFKVSVVRDGVIERDYKPVILRHSILSTKIWVESIGAGGGSIAWIDSETGLLKVGPQGAGALPGPVCYGVGGEEPTVSDADLILGYLNPDYFLGGRMKLDKERTLAAIREKVAKPLKVSEVEAASAIYRIANSHMSDLIRKATVEKGHDPRSFVLFAFGGAGPVHASRYAAELGIRQVVIPLTASVHGATGLISSDLVYEYGKSDHVVVPVEIGHVNDNFSTLLSKALNDLRAAGFDQSDIRVMRSVDMRYRYQVHELNVPFPAGISAITDQEMEDLYARFDQLYEKAFGQGSGYREAGKEILTFRLTATGLLKKPDMRPEPVRSSNGEEAAKGHREVYFEEEAKFIPTRVYNFEKMQPGTAFPGPAIIETPVTTIVVNPNDRADMDEFRNIRIHLGGC
ncbi:MAG TPA: hydantoinase/oxoprolinase family protein [Methylomirabilota bacterium]|nr:hydantoinase/oxoprolinase family protein [Methylomirabilota bacterium]